MARKPGEKRDLARARDNQRNARARQRDLIESLKKRVNELELQKGMANAQLQLAARFVLQDNQRLRRLCHAKGMSKEEIEGISTTMSTIADVSTARQIIAGRDRHYKGTMQIDNDELADVTAFGAAKESHEELEAAAATETATKPTVPASGKCCKKTTSRCIPAAESTDDGLETPCFVAASILADLRGHTDHSVIQAELGCKDMNTCRIKNTDLFAAMDV